MNTKAFTLLETVLATLIAMGVMMGSVAVLESMNAQSHDFQARVTRDMNWIEANQHITRNVHSSAFLFIPPNDPNTLELYNYGGTIGGGVAGGLRGIYRNTQAGITYTDDTTGLGNRDANNPFQSVNATFRYVTAGTVGKGWRDNKAIEGIIDYAQPFTSTISLSCRVAITGSPASSTWARVFGGLGHEQAYDIERTYKADGSPDGYVIAGYTSSYHHFHGGDEDAYLIKIDMNGNVGPGYSGTWVAVFGWAGSDCFREVIQTRDRSQIVAVGDASFTTVFTPYMKAYLIGINYIRGFGDVSCNWFGRYTPPVLTHNQPVSGSSVEQINNGYIVGAGLSWDKESLLIKTNDRGSVDPVYPNTFNRAEYYNGGALVRQVPGGYILSGYTNCIVGANTIDGAIIWSKQVGRSSYWIRAFEKTYNSGGNQDGFVMVGYSANSGDIYIARTNLNGDIPADNPRFFEKTIHGSVYRLPSAVQQVSDGGYIIAGLENNTHPHVGGEDFSLVKLDEFGEVEWAQKFGDKGDRYFDCAMAVQEAHDGGYVVVGVTSGFSPSPDIYVVKTDADGNCPEASKPTSMPAAPF